MKGNNKFKQTEIGRIPKDWEVGRLGDEDIADLIMGQSPPSSTYNDKNTGIPFLQGNAEFGDIYPTPVLSCSQPTKLSEKNDILLSVRAPVGDVNIAPEKLCIGRGLAAIRPKRKKLNFLFLFYYLKFGSKIFESISMGSTFKAIRKEEVVKFNLPLPPLPEQQKIAAILSTADETIQKVDEAIMRTQRLKQGLMNNLLTQGIGHKKYKDTEIGRIPKEWGKIKLGEVASVRYGLGQPPELDNNGVPMVRATNIKRGAITKTGLVYIKRSAIPNSRNPFLKEGEIIVVRSGAYTGDSALITKEWTGAVAGYDLIVSPSSDINSKFLAYYLLSDTIQKYFSGQSVRSAQQHLNSQQVEEAPIPLPPLPEQQKIAEILGTVDNKLEMLKEKKERFGNIKKGLMNDLLTGQKRVKVN